MSKKVRYFAISVVAILICSIVALFVIAHIFVRKFQPEIRKQAVQYLEDRFDAKVDLGGLDVSVPNVSAVGLLLHKGAGTVARVAGWDLVIHRHGNESLPPLFAAKTFHFELDLGVVFAPKPSVAHVALDGVAINIPPKGERQPSEHNGLGFSSKVVIDRLDLTNTHFVILPKNADRRPLDFVIQSLKLGSASAVDQMTYEADLMNPRPPGQIVSKGKFGPWKRDEPGDTPLEGDYTFTNADLGVFKAIAGTLDSKGTFTGSLSAVSVQGEANVPDFRLKSSNNKVPLRTHFEALVDGTNGDTILKPVRAQLQNTYFVTSGGIIKRQKFGRRSIDLDVTMNRGHMEDLLRLAVKGKPFMTGLINMKSKISIPPFDEKVKEKLILDGSFSIDSGEFAKDVVQDKIDELSRRGQGKPNDPTVDNVFSSMAGTFKMEDEKITFSRLSFGVPGADVNLHGSYSMDPDAIDFHGTLRLKAKVSQTLGGWKRWVAKPLDPFFAKNGAGTFLRIQVVGTSKKPEFGRDKGGDKTDQAAIPPARK